MEKVFVLTEQAHDGVIIDQVVSPDREKLYQYMKSAFQQERDRLEKSYEPCALTTTLIEHYATILLHGELRYKWEILECSQL